MPQLDPSSFPSQLFWLAVSFSLMCYIMARMVLPRIASTLQTRQDKISGDLDAAEKLREEAEQLEQEYERSLIDNRHKANAIITESKADMQELWEKEHAQLEEVLAEKAREADDEIAGAKNKVMKELSSISLTLSQEIVNKLAGIKPEKISAKQWEKAVGE